MQQATTSKQLLSFVRINEGLCEKVTWFKNPDGSKFAKREPFKPSVIELINMSKSKYGEAYI